MIQAVIILPWLIMPVIIAYISKGINIKRKFTYLLVAVFVPCWPLILTLAGILADDGFVLAGTSVLVIPLILFLQKVVNKLILKQA